MRILIIDQCSGAKRSPDWYTKLDAAEIDSHSLEELRNRERTPTYPARELYTGRQQRYIDSAVATLREVGDDVDRIYISAGFGVVDEETELVPYEVTFKDFSPEEIVRRGKELGIQGDLASKVVDRFDLVFFALGSDYYRSFDLPTVLDSIPESTMVVLFNGHTGVTGRDNVVAISARNEEAKVHGAAVIGLKGRYLQHFATYRTHGAPVGSLQDIVDYCTTEYDKQSGIYDFRSSKDP